MSFITPAPSRRGLPGGASGRGPSMGPGTPGGASSGSPLDLDAAIALIEATLDGLQRDGVRAVETLPATLSVTLTPQRTVALKLPVQEGEGVSFTVLVAGWRDMLNRLKRHKGLLEASGGRERPASRLQLSLQEQQLMEAIGLALEPRAKP